MINCTETFSVVLIDRGLVHQQPQHALRPFTKCQAPITAIRFQQMIHTTWFTLHVQDTASLPLCVNNLHFPEKLQQFFKSNIVLSVGLDEVQW